MIYIILYINVCMVMHGGGGGGGTTAQGHYAWSCPNGLRLVFTAKTSLSQFSGIHESEKRSPNAVGRPTAKSANYQA